MKYVHTALSLCLPRAPLAFMFLCHIFHLTQYFNLYTKRFWQHASLLYVGVGSTPGTVLPLFRSLCFVVYNGIYYLDWVPMGRITSYVQSVVIIVFLVYIYIYTHIYTGA